MAHNPRLFCIHGHFYQPPREDPWLGRILIESSAAPMRHWNERIVAESYGPLGWAHRLGQGGKIIEICNCYEWMSFNVGPTLMDWLQRESPIVYNRICEADAASIKRFGHGNAMAQVYHHAIMPLATPLDKELETAWAVMDFEKHFSRKPEGMWLAESAVDTASLEVLAKEGISFVILAPRQAKAIAGPDGVFHPVADGGFDVTRPYRIVLPSGASISVFFYHGPLSQAVAFERLLEDGENFWNRISQNASGGMLMLATDGETYGHHFPFGEMALAHVLAQGREGRDGLSLCNPAAYLAAHPPVETVVLHEPSSWSCVHGVERWRSDCGCTDGGHPDWNQRWRAPLRDALTEIKTHLDEHFLTAGEKCFLQPGKALREFGRVLADRGFSDTFAAEHIVGRGHEKLENADLGWKLLAMQEQALASFASCAWFFDDISRIEPVNSMTFMWRALELAMKTGGPDLRDTFRKLLGRACSNKIEEGTGADILTDRVIPRQQNVASLSLTALTLMEIEGALPGIDEESTFGWPAFSIKIRVHSIRPGIVRIISGKAVLGTPLEKCGTEFSFEWHSPDRQQQGPACAAFEKNTITLTMADGKTVTSCLASLSRRIKEYVGLRLIEIYQQEAAMKSACIAQHLLATMEPWEEGQQSLPYTWDWVGIAPYLLAACVTSDTMEEAKREQAVIFLRSLNICEPSIGLAWRTVEKALLRELKKNDPDWAMLANWVVRAKRYLNKMNFWAVQNTFSQHPGEAPEKALLGAALNF